MDIPSIDSYSRLIDRTEKALDEADQFADTHKKRMSHEEVFSEISKKLNRQRISQKGITP